MIRTAILLLFALLVIPTVALLFDPRLTALQQKMLFTSGRFMLGAALLCFLVSELTRNYSQVDKLWSLLPILYAWYFAWESGWNERLVVMAALVSLWGLRLTYNFARKGAYRWKFWEGTEDYRWLVLRSSPPLNHPVRWRLFNLFFISLYQNALILLFTLPAVAVAASQKNLVWPDAVIAFLFLAFLTIETIADEQMWRFQQRKKISSRSTQGFISSGLWSLVRHPNYTAEQAVWLTFYLFSVVATGQWINWSLSGAVLLMLLFQGSSDFSEKISSSKYPEYVNYRKQVPRFLPRFMK
jgi:steroid 5-alpha reductase family enzyme